MNAREAALNALCEVDEGINLKEALGVTFEKDDLPDEERALATELAFGTLRHCEEIDQILRETYNSDFTSLDNILKNVLRIAVYQYLFLERIPIYAIVNEAVNFGRTLKERGLINAVLRGVIRNKRVQALRIPRAWVLRQIVDAYPVNGEKIIESFKIRPTPYVRINLLKNSMEEVEEKLRRAGLEFVQGNWFPEFKAVSRLGSIINSSVMKEGYVSIHDEGQGMVCHLVAPQKGEKIIDLCSAPGSKTTYMAELMHDQGMMIAIEVSSQRLGMVQENAARLALNIIRPVLADGRRYSIEDVDKVLVDAPCSNSGVVAKRPEVKERVNAKVIARLSRLQLDLLNNATTCIKKGGSIIYSTCSILPQENEEIVEQFLGQHKNFELEPAKDFTPIGDTYLKILPGEYYTDGLFAARMKRKK
ncbi:16S rRNA (cytosine(967)-C(5))-methyltransferase [candidate division WOR-3 bacterium RBG_13_43_14]|uniref:16S rRNA (cytosine(967)-C(5))-methyltransferase n=1 Tax=candidate division WOR-3 bacterium RBG_13_43_14 TaxID=1802590 RepID=A0A1F4UA28_UNCW3|nr:MAG: 16S rRNA (cytosine(967)-C(5))-methyltransferase [candidate division WOR-3 bacterium RBG_13_43_14]